MKSTVVRIMLWLALLFLTLVNSYQGIVISAQRDLIHIMQGNPACMVGAPQSKPQPAKPSWRPGDVIVEEN